MTADLDIAALGQVLHGQRRCDCGAWPCGYEIDQFYWEQEAQAFAAEYARLTDLPMSEPMTADTRTITQEQLTAAVQTMLDGPRQVQIIDNQDSEMGSLIFASEFAAAIFAALPAIGPLTYHVEYEMTDAAERLRHSFAGTYKGREQSRLLDEALKAERKEERERIRAAFVAYYGDFPLVAEAWAIINGPQEEES